MPGDDDQTGNEAVEARFPRAGDISSGDAANAQSNRARLRYFAENESNENPKRKGTMALARATTRLRDY
jgi:hypothetical protein